MKRRTVIVTVASIITLILIVAALVLLLNPTIGRANRENIKTATAKGEDFLFTLKEADFEGAYGMLNSDVQEEIKNPKTFENLFPPGTIDSWEYKANIVKTDTDEQGVSLIGTISLADGGEVDMMLILVNVDGVDKIAGYSFQPIE